MLLVIGIVDIFGGFGNQLFQISFALHLKQKGIKTYTYISDSLLNNENKEYQENRNLIISSSDFGITMLSKKHLYILDKYKKNKILKNSYQILTENDFIDYENLKYINSFNGFWQKIKYVEDNIDDLTRALSVNQKIKMGLSENKKKNTMLLVRRGDYEKSGLALDLNFYEKAMEKLDLTLGYDIFTDDPSWVENQKIFENVSYIYPPSDQRDEVIDLFSEMLSYKNFVVGNSTFSFWGALLGSNEKSTVIISKDFYSKIELETNNKFNNWIKI